MPNVKKTSCIIDFISCILSSDMLMGYLFGWSLPVQAIIGSMYVRVFRQIPR